MAAIFKKEFRSFMRNMIGPVFMAAVMLFVGLYYFANNIVYGYPYFAVSLSGVSIVLLLLVPVLTMRSFAEEKRSKTDQMLLTSPLSVTQIVCGKFFAMTAVFGMCMLAACLGPVILHFYGATGMFSDYLAIAAFLLLGAAYIAIGMFISSLTENQVIAAAGTFCILLMLQLVKGLASMMSDSSMFSLLALIIAVGFVALLLWSMTESLTIAGIVWAVAAVIMIVVYLCKKTLFEGLFAALLGSLSLVSRFDELLYQTLDISIYIYYISISALFIFLTVQVIEKRRWS